MSTAASGLAQPADREQSTAPVTGRPARGASGGPARDRSVPTRHLVTADPAATRSVAARLGAAARPGDVIALDGPLGAGKTEFARGFAAGLGVAGRVSSPSFVLMAEHQGRLPLFHLDGYRLGGPEDAWSSGLLDERRSEGVTVIEWASRFGPALPAGRLAITIDGAGDEPRAISLRGTDRRHRRLLAAVLGPADPAPPADRAVRGGAARARVVRP
jgi:tRNA threonylcarbamoyladenosine biosynthesis protein TsaE